MKDFVQMWTRMTGRRYSNVNTSDRELGDLSNNRMKRSDIRSFEVNFDECEGLNNKYNEDIDFHERKNAIINKLFEKRKKGQIGRPPKCLFVLLMLGFFALGTGCFILFLHPYDFLFKHKILLQDGGEIFEMWRKPEVDLYCRVFLFNITNAEEFMDGRDSKIKLKEIGPYVYREALEHEVISFNKNGTLSAVPRHPLTWVEELSEGHSEDDVLYLPHIALLSIAHVVAQKDMMTRFGLNNLIRFTGSKPLLKMTAREFMMGHKSELMTLGNTFLPGWIYFDKLGLIDRMYDFTGDFETIYTGATDITKSGLIDTYKGSTDLPQWEGKHCSNVQNASDATKFKSGLERNETVLFYRKSLCRAAPLIPVEEGTRGGLKAYKYVFPEHMMDNGKYIEENKCFCRNDNCLPDGLIDVADCYYGFPIALSYPHFYKADEALFGKMEGLQPDESKHATRFWIQPESGLPLEVSAKFQINMALADISNIEHTERFANMYLPLLWFDIRMYHLTPALEQRFKLYLNILPIVEQAAMYMLFFIGSGLILLTVYILTFKVMFKTFDQKKHRNIVIGSDMWTERECKWTNKDKIYAACEVPLNETESDSDVQFETERRPSLLKSHSDKIKELSLKLQDSVGSVKDLVKEEYCNVKNKFNDRKDSLLKVDELNLNDTYKSDSSDDERRNGYKKVGQTDSDDECKYLEVVDDGSEFVSNINYDGSERSKKLRELD